MGKGPQVYKRMQAVQEDGFYPTCSTFILYSGGSGVARNGREITTRTQTVVACDQGACSDALDSVPWVLGQPRGCIRVTFM